MVETT